MTVRQSFDSAQRRPRYSKEEFSQRSDEIDKTQVRPQIEEGNHGKIVAINIETGTFEIDASEIVALERADIILLLISSDFIASNYCYEKEMKRALERHNAKEARVIPVIVRDCDWDIEPLRKLQALPKAGKAVKLWPDKDTAWKNVAEGISRVIGEMKGDRLL
jgi:TIR domain